MNALQNKREKQNNIKASDKLRSLLINASLKQSGFLTQLLFIHLRNDMFLLQPSIMVEAVLKGRRE